MICLNARLKLDLLDDEITAKAEYRRLEYCRQIITITARTAKKAQRLAGNESSESLLSDLRDSFLRKGDSSWLKWRFVAHAVTHKTKKQIYEEAISETETKTKPSWELYLSYADFLDAQYHDLKLANDNYQKARALAKATQDPRAEANVLGDFTRFLTQHHWELCQRRMRFGTGQKWHDLFPDTKQDRKWQRDLTTYAEEYINCVRQGKLTQAKHQANVARLIAFFQLMGQEARTKTLCLPSMAGVVGTEIREEAKTYFRLALQLAAKTSAAGCPVAGILLPIILDFVDFLTYPKRHQHNLEKQAAGCLSVAHWLAINGGEPGNLPRKRDQAAKLTKEGRWWCTEAARFCREALQWERHWQKSSLEVEEAEDVLRRACAEDSDCEKLLVEFAWFLAEIRQNADEARSFLRRALCGGRKSAFLTDMYSLLIVKCGCRSGPQPQSGRW